jgi:hypothetical protein
MPKRDLTLGEIEILTIIQQGYGAHNTLDRVCFSNENDAVLFVKTTKGMNILLANISHLANGRANGTIANDEELRIKWLRLKA